MDENKVQLDKQISKQLDKLQQDPYEDLAKQCDAEWNIAWLHQKPKKDEALQRLKLYNNQRRDKKQVGDTTMFSIFQTMLASLYVDKLTASWTGREDGDDDVADNWNAISEYDYTEMGKDIIDYNWIWDTLFFGRGLVDQTEYIRDPDNNIYLPIARNIDPMVFLRDPRAASVNGDRMGRNSARFFGEETRMTKESIKENPHAVQANIDFRSIKFGSGTKSLLEDNRSARDNAQGLTFDRNKDEKYLGANAEYDITIWNTNWRMTNGKVEKVRVWLANNRKLVVGFQVIKTGIWRVNDRPLFPTSHNWDGTSIPDLTEDKQRARAVAQNLGLDAMKADLYPMYIYNSNKIKNKNDLNFNFNKFIPAEVADGQSVLDAIQPLRKSTPNMQLLDFIYQSIDASAQKATATSDIQQGIQSQASRPLGETNILVANGQNRYSLGAKVFGWSERRFWLNHYDSYKENFKDNIDEKTLRIVGAFGAVYRKLTKDQITTKKIDPDVKIDSMVMNRAKQLEERQALTGYFTLILADPTTNKRYAFKELGHLYGLPKDKLDRLLPPTIDERIADDENKLLSDNKPVKVQVADDHEIHLEIHMKAAATAASYAHIETHKKALSIKKVNPTAFPPSQQDIAAQQMMGNKQTNQNAPTMGNPAQNTPNKPIAPSDTSMQPGSMMQPTNG